MLSNGRWVMTAHRVRKVSEERYSAPLFFNLDYDAEIAPSPHLVAADGAAHYPAVRAGEHSAQTAQSFSYMKADRARRDANAERRGRILKPERAERADGAATASPVRA